MDQPSGEQDPAEGSPMKSDQLQDLDIEICDQTDLERDINRQADQLLNQRANEQDEKRLEKTASRKDQVAWALQKLQQRRDQSTSVAQRARYDQDIGRLRAQVDKAMAEIFEIEERMEQRRRNVDQPTTTDSGSGRLQNESNRDFLIRTGKITPFSRIGQPQPLPRDNLQDALFDAEEELPGHDSLQATDLPPETIEFMSHRNLRQPGFKATSHTNQSFEADLDVDRPKKRRKLPQLDTSSPPSGESYQSHGSVSDSVHEDDPSEEDSEIMQTTKPVSKGRRRRKEALASDNAELEDLSSIDDGNAAVYRSRLRKWVQQRREARQEEQRGRPDTDNFVDASTTDEIEDEMYKPHPTIEDTHLNGGYKIPGDIYPSLFDYQKTGVNWLWELYTLQVGGIVGDEMGLGKTIQIIAFLAGLHYSKMLTKPILVVCPATVMKQWVAEFHRWWPPFRVVIMHSSGSGMIDLGRESRQEEELSDQEWSSHTAEPLTTGQKKAQKVLEPLLRHGGVLITTYAGVLTYAPLLIPLDWDYCILDEGHKIRNPNSAITIYTKELRSTNRVILSGTPMQNNLIELWSLFDFVYPMRLGTLVGFRTQFEIPIRQGGYANASNLQVQVAIKCAETLKETISPYLLQRFKVDVAADLPKKTDRVVFCKLTKLQRKAYHEFLDTDAMKAVLSGRKHVLFGIDILRKICNHPDLEDHRNRSKTPGYNYGDPAKSGKMKIVGHYLRIWKVAGHKTLLFAQHRIMLDILEKFVRSMPGIRYMRMDGTTPIPLRQSMVDDFNTHPDLHVFLLTTKVGGLGINLTGANRVIIYDPDWNPSTDQQARERAWRLGQKREVEIYRLMTAGTIEEKIFSRQMFKTYLIKKVMQDPTKRQTFQASDLQDLFTLAAEGADTEIGTIFKDANIQTVAGSETDKMEDNKAVSQDLRQVPGVASIQQIEDEVEEPPAEGSSRSEARLMGGLFPGSNNQSAEEHDKVVGDKRVITADPQMVEREARKVAAIAARELDRAGEVAKTVPAGTPTWTGQVGISGRPEESEPSSVFGSRNHHEPSSSSGLLAGLSRRPQVGSVGGTNGVSGVSTPSELRSRGGTPIPASRPQFDRMIREYLVAHGGSVFTQMLIDHFNRYCTSPPATQEFKQTLKKVATLVKGTRGRGKWVLKKEYQPAE